MRILVCGGCGFLGSHFLKYISHKFDTIINVDKLTYCGNVRNLEGCSDRIINYLYTDIADEHAINSILETHKIDIIVNFSAETHVDRSIKNPKEFLETDILGIFNLLQCARKNNIKKLVHISTDEVYGEIEYPDEATEDYPLKPNSPYSASKAAADMIIRSFIRTYNFPAILIRPCNNYGPNQYPEKLLPVTIARLKEGKKAIIHGDGSEIREWIHVDNCCRAIYGIMNKGRIGEIYNVGSGNRQTNLSMVQYIVHAMFKKNRNNDYFRGHIEFIDNRPGNDKRYAINSNKTEELVGKYCKIDMKYGLAETIEWYLENDWIWNNVDLEMNRHSREESLEFE